MPDRAEGTVVSRDGQDVVVDIQGQRWTVRWWQVDCGSEYETRSGEWIREPDPRIRRYIERRLSELDGIHPDSRAYWRNEYRWILQRNGWADEVKC